MRKVKMKVIVMSLVVVMCSNMDVLAQRDGQRRMNRPQGQEMREKKEPRIPNLTDEQKTQLKNARIKHHKEVLPIKNELREKRARLKTLTSTNTSKNKEIDNVIEDIGALQTKMMKAKVAHLMGMKQFLTEEQQLFLETRKDHKMRKNRKMGNGK